MTTIAASALVPGVQLQTGQLPILPPVANPVQITGAVITNVSGSSATVTVYVVRSGGAAGATNTVISAQSIAAGAAYIAKELIGRNLDVGDYLVALASANSSLNIIVDGITITS